MNSDNPVFFAPQLYVKNGISDISFYCNAFGALELRRWSNEDGSLNVAELSINGALFHLRQEGAKPGSFSPDKYNGTTARIGLFVADVDAVMVKAIAAGAVKISAPQDYDYGFRQGELKDPFGHHWLIEKQL